MNSGSGWRNQLLLSFDCLRVRMIVRKKTNSGQIKYCVRVMSSDRSWLPSKTFDKKGEAEAYERNLFDQNLRGAKLLPGVNYTLNEYWERWNVERGIEWGRSYRRDTESRYKNYIQPVLGSKSLRDIDSSTISRLMADLKGKGLSASTRNAIQGNLNRMFRDALNFYRILLSNPVRDDHRAKSIKKERSYWTPNECYRFLDSVRDHRYGIAYWIMVWNGFRIGEILGLKHSDIDLESGVFHIKRQFNKNEYRLKALKNGVEYSPKIAPPLLEYLKEKLSECPNSNELIIKGEKGWSVAKYKNVSSDLTKAAKAVGLKRLTPHELRHSMTGLWIQVGATETDLQKLLNHKSTVSTKGYMHHTPDRIDMLAAKLQMPSDNIILINSKKSG